MYEHIDALDNSNVIAYHLKKPSLVLNLVFHSSPFECIYGGESTSKVNFEKKSKIQLVGLVNSEI